MKRGSLIAFEGLDGSGKSTQLAALAAAFATAGVDACSTREPTDGPFGARIRAMAASGQAVSAEQELHWFVEDRRQHVAQVIEPALASGRVVITDRYFLSTVAYQGARGLDPDQLLETSEREHPLPDLAILLEVEPAAGLARVRARGAPVESVFEVEGFLVRVAEIFASLERPYLARVDGRGEVDAVHAAVVEVVRARLGLL